MTSDPYVVPFGFIAHYEASDGYATVSDPETFRVWFWQAGRVHRERGGILVIGTAIDARTWWLFVRPRISPWHRRHVSDRLPNGRWARWST